MGLWGSLCVLFWNESTTCWKELMKNWEENSQVMEK